LWYERLRVRHSLIAQIKKLEDVESEKTRTLERIRKNSKKRKGRQSPGERKMGHGENLDQIDSSVGQIWPKQRDLPKSGNLWRMETERSHENQRGGRTVQMFREIDDKENALV
jgi:hypothetical protein